MAWWSRKEGLAAEPKKSVPDGVWVKCSKCSSTLYEPEWVQNSRVCVHCGFHDKLPIFERIELIIDEGSWVERDATLQSADPLSFKVDGKKYKDLLKAAQKKTGLQDAYISGEGNIAGIAVEFGAFAFEFMGGSMGSVVGEKITRQFERALRRGVPAVVLCASGGARMQEGTLSLMQMAKTASARARLKEAGIPYISVLLHPTTGGVAASIAMLGDIIIAEPGALIGFAGPRVIEQTIRQQLPEQFQRAEFLLSHGMIDQVVERQALKQTLGRMLGWLGAAPNAEVGASTPGQDGKTR